MPRREERGDQRVSQRQEWTTKKVAGEVKGARPSADFNGAIISRYPVPHHMAVCFSFFFFFFLNGFISHACPLVHWGESVCDLPVAHDALRVPIINKS
jgi:hypothetical protein